MNSHFLTAAVALSLVMLTSSEIHAKEKKKTPTPAGFKIVSVESGSIFEKLNFKKGDVITTVNGQSMATVPNPSAMLEYLNKPGNMEIQFVRNGQPQTLTFHFKE